MSPDELMGRLEEERDRAILKVDDLEKKITSIDAHRKKLHADLRTVIGRLRIYEVQSPVVKLTQHRIKLAVRRANRISKIRERIRRIELELDDPWETCP